MDIIALRLDKGPVKIQKQLWLPSSFFFTSIGQYHISRLIWSLDPLEKSLTKICTRYIYIGHDTCIINYKVFIYVTVFLLISIVTSISIGIYNQLWCLLEIVFDQDFTISFNNIFILIKIPLGQDLGVCSYYLWYHFIFICSQIITEYFAPLGNGSVACQKGNGNICAFLFAILMVCWCHNSHY